MAIPDFNGKDLNTSTGGPTRVRLVPVHPQLNVKWEVREKEELAEYYLHKARKQTSISEICFFLRGYLTIKNITPNFEYLKKEVKHRIAFIYDRGYSMEDIARNFYLSHHVISKILSNDSSIKKNTILGLAFQIKEDLILN